MRSSSSDRFTGTTLAPSAQAAKQVIGTSGWLWKSVATRAPRTTPAARSERMRAATRAPNAA